MNGLCYKMRLAGIVTILFLNGLVAGKLVVHNNMGQDLTVAIVPIHLKETDFSVQYHIPKSSSLVIHIKPQDLKDCSQYQVTSITDCKNLRNSLTTKLGVDKNYDLTYSKKDNEIITTLVDK